MWEKVCRAVLLHAQKRGGGDDSAAGETDQPVVIDHVIAFWELCFAPFRAEGLPVRRNCPAKRAGKVRLFDQKVKSELPVGLVQRRHAHDICGAKAAGLGDDFRLAPACALVAGPDHCNVTCGMVMIAGPMIAAVCKQNVPVGGSEKGPLAVAGITGRWGNLVYQCAFHQKILLTVCGLDRAGLPVENPKSRCIG